MSIHLTTGTLACLTTALITCIDGLYSVTFHPFCMCIVLLLPSQFSSRSPFWTIGLMSPVLALRLYICEFGALIDNGTGRSLDVIATTSFCSLRLLIRRKKSFT